MDHAKYSRQTGEPLETRLRHLVADIDEQLIVVRRATAQLSTLTADILYLAHEIPNPCDPGDPILRAIGEKAAAGETR